MIQRLKTFDINGTQVSEDNLNKFLLDLNLQTIKGSNESKISEWINQEAEKISIKKICQKIAT